MPKENEKVGIAKDPSNDMGIRHFAPLVGPDIFLLFNATFRSKFHKEISRGIKHW